jgi:hypothetical protein
MAKWKRGKVVAALALMAFQAVAADDASVLRCRGVADPQARLSCYDALPLGPAAVGVPTPARAPTTAPAAPAPVQRASEDRFGIESQARETPLAAIESRIPGRFEGWQANTRIRLANGQVWQIADGSFRILDLDNPKVAIRRSAMGAFYLDLEGDNRSPRVRRVQ